MLLGPFEQSVTCIERDVSNIPGPICRLFIKVSVSSFPSLIVSTLLKFHAWTKCLERCRSKATRRETNFSRDTSVFKKYGQARFFPGKYEHLTAVDRIFSWKIVPLVFRINTILRIISSNWWLSLRFIHSYEWITCLLHRSFFDRTSRLWNFFARSTTIQFNFQF